ncbi:phage capsid protein [Bartonella sp. DGB2]|uniref:phage capsid protein n=1 Tax=Bartonella sp. DGB2 TaxID=3388426 RepID=UPI00398F9E31
MTQNFSIKDMISHPGQRNAQGDEWALFRTEFITDVMAQYHALCLYRERHQVRRIERSKSATFPLIGGTKATYLEAGAFIEGQKFQHSDVTILLDNPTAANVYLADFEEDMSPVDFRAHYSQEMGTALATMFDQNVARVAVQAAREKSYFVGGDGGSIIKGGKDVATDGELIKNTLFKAMELFNYKKVPQTERFCFVSPTTYAAAAATTDLINKNWGGEGSLAQGKLGTVAGITIISTINLPQGDQRADSDVLPRYRGDFSKTAFHLMHRDAVGTVMLKEMTTSIDWVPTNQSTLLTAKYMAGHGVLRPECAIEVTTEEAA